MQLIGLFALALAAPSSALVRFHCSQLVVERLDPLVNPGSIPSAHVHQIVGGVCVIYPFPIHGPALTVET